MAQAFKRQQSRAIGSVGVAVGGYSPAANVLAATVIGFSVANTCQAALAVDVYFFDGTNKTYLVKGAPLPVGGALCCIGGEQKVVMLPGDSLYVDTNTVQANAGITPTADAILSVLELS